MRGILPPTTRNFEERAVNAEVRLKEIEAQVEVLLAELCEINARTIEHLAELTRVGERYDLRLSSIETPIRIIEKRNRHTDSEYLRLTEGISTGFWLPVDTVPAISATN